MYRQPKVVKKTQSAKATLRKKQPRKIRRVPIVSTLGQYNAQHKRPFRPDYLAMEVEHNEFKSRQARKQWAKMQTLDVIAGRAFSTNNIIQKHTRPVNPFKQQQQVMPTSSLLTTTRARFIPQKAVLINNGRYFSSTTTTQGEKKQAIHEYLACMYTITPDNVPKQQQRPHSP
eukprot:UN04400